MDADTPLFEEQLAEEIKNYLSLQNILEEERKCLVARDFDAFTQLLGEKHLVLGQLEQRNLSRCKLLQARGHSIDKDGVLALISNLSAEKQAPCQENWRLLNELIDDCSRLNSINARITHRAQSSNHHMLNLLRGDSAGFELYGKNGTSHDRNGPLTITKV